MSGVGSRRLVNGLSRVYARASTWAGHQLDPATTYTSGRPSVSALVLQAIEELGDTLDLNSSKGAEAQKVGVATDDHLGFCIDGAFQNAVVRGVNFDLVDAFGRLDEPGDDTQLPVGFSNPRGRAVELVAEDAKVSAMMASEMARST